MGHDFMMSYTLSGLYNLKSRYMNQLTIDIKNAFEAPKMDRTKVCRSGYVRRVRFVDSKEHSAPSIYEDDLLGMLSDGSI